MIILSVNYLAVLVASVVVMGIGAFWYSPAAFGKQWAAMMGWNEAAMKDKMRSAKGSSYAIAFVGNLVMAFVIAQLIANIGTTTVADALMLAFWVWLGFIATAALNTVLWEGKPWHFYGINTAYHLVSMVVMSLILTMWV